MNDIRNYLVVDTLKNGTTVTIRAIRPEDKIKIVSAFIVQIGRQKHVSRFEATVLSRNQAMLKVFAGSGLPMKQQRDGTEVQITLFLGETSSAAE